MKTPPERFRELLEGFGPEDIGEIEKRLAEPSESARETSWRDDPDPFGRDWDWLQGLEEGRERAPRPGDVNSVEPTGPSEVIPLAPRPGAPGVARRLLWVSGIAASLVAAAFGTWSVFRRGPIQERDVAAWVTERLEPGAGGIRIAAPAGGDDEAEAPVLKGLDRPLDALAPSAPNVYAPLRIQEQLVIPEVAPHAAPGLPARAPVRSVAESVHPGSLFYLEFTTASAPSIGSAVVVVLRGGVWSLLSDELAVSPADKTAYIGPLKMDDDGASYFVILADRTSTPLLTTASRAVAAGDGAAPTQEALRSRITDALKEAGHSWYGIQRIEVRPESRRERPPQDKP